MFELDTRLADDTFPIARLTLCEVRLMNEPVWPWLILVPARPDIREILDLSPVDRHLLIEEIAMAERVLRDLHAPDKLNVGALGNQVPQLHIHVIARRTDDPAWPGPVWGAVPRSFYGDSQAAAEIARLKDAFRTERQKNA